MPQDPREKRGASQMTPEEYRRMQAAKAERRAKRQRQKLMVLGAFALAAIILIVCIVLVIRSIFTKKDDSTTTTSTSSSFVENNNTEPVVTWPTASDVTLWNLALVNEQHKLSANFAEPATNGIVRMVGNDAVTYYFDERIVDELNRMLADCNMVEGHDLQLVSGYRRYGRQETYYNYQVSLLEQNGYSAEDAREEAKRYESTPGASDHHTGLAVDFVIGSATVVDDLFGNSAEFAWLQQNAASYGFILRYPGEKEAITGMYYQPYHWRYVGTEAAQAITGAGICLEEYLSALPAGNASGTGADDPALDGSGEGKEGEPESTSGTEEA